MERDAGHVRGHLRARTSKTGTMTRPNKRTRRLSNVENFRSVRSNPMAQSNTPLYKSSSRSNLGHVPPTTRDAVGRTRRRDTMSRRHRRWPSSNRAGYCGAALSFAVSVMNPGDYAYDPETKQQSMMWVFQDEPNLTKVIRAKITLKQIVACYFAMYDFECGLPPHASRPASAGAAVAPAERGVPRSHASLSIYSGVPSCTASVSFNSIKLPFTSFQGTE
ncbi:hypothetical protein EVAR_28725_1 [Eumeta japonica]|uniref:Uncharacterized protein n=1 Tax=Eumeta variegata TaxID=151549 RepID=A0A4C1V4Q7_EUMVA|nr:hypothetical protein EVAR_28725_1 [Eumeta japonica]